ncbi:transposase [Pseudomonas sp. SWRI51]|uniref:transposase n=1 Tax=Pseudomonas sp. SWRI51 TaxID=2745491 RepID=UPI001EE296BC|nr:transposase [Pseudomonas sp. SWRI51]
MNGIIHGRFSHSLDPVTIRERITVRPEPVSSLAECQPLIGGAIFAKALSEIFLPNQFSIQLIQEMVGRAKLHFDAIFASEVEYVSRIYTPPEADIYPICLTGLAGVGKSRTIAALRKVMPEPVEFYSSHYDGHITLASHWYASAKEKVSGKSLLIDYLYGGGKPPSGSQEKFLLEARRQAYRYGVPLALLDETQFFNLGIGTAKITEIILTMASIGPPSLFVSNYSLVHRLLGRNSEDKQRLLSLPRIMLPDPPGSKDWADYVEECVRVSNGCIRPGTGDFAGDLYRYTFGIKRLAVQLLSQAYIECRNDGRYWIEQVDLARAYRSAAYTSNAKDVEDLHTDSLGSGQSSIRLDLKCPFDLPAAYKSNVVKFAKDERHQRMVARVFDSALTKAERLAQQQIEVPVAPAPRKSTRKPVAEKLSEQETREAFFGYIDFAGKPKKPV